MDIVCANLERKFYLVSPGRLEKTVSHIAIIERALFGMCVKSSTGVSARTTSGSAEFSDSTWARGKSKVEILEVEQDKAVGISADSRPQDLLQVRTLGLPQTTSWNIISFYFS